MNTFIYILTGCVLLVLIAAAIKGKSRRSYKGNDINKGDYRKKKVLTETEQVLFHRLVEAMPECIVLTQVSMYQVISAAGQEQLRKFRYISQKSLDFVLCKKDFSVITVIELDDASHKQHNRQRADNTKEQALEAADVKIIRWQAAKMPDVEAIRRQLGGLLAGTSSAPR